MILHGDCSEELKKLDSSSVDSLVTDPPAGISFMGKDWDGDKGGRKQWCAWMTSVMKECLRVLKPGAHGLVWAIPRTSHWTATALEDAGFEIRDVVTHLFGSGFPKSLDISKAIDKAAGAARLPTGRVKPGHEGFDGTGKAGTLNHAEGWDRPWMRDPEKANAYHMETAPATDDAKQWQGWGTALKPAAEFWILVRKPCSEKTVAKNVLKWGTGALNIDGSRIEASADYGRSAANSKGTVNAHNGFDGKAFKISEREADYASPLGRFPANLVLSGDAIEMLDAQSGISKSTGGRTVKRSGAGYVAGAGINQKSFTNQDPGFGDVGGASRFFYCAKISSSERGKDNTHPTVKPKKLMSYLIRMITPPNGTVLDPFMGSGSTGVAAKEQGFQFIGIEKEKEYFEISQKRVEAVLI